MAAADFVGRPAEIMVKGRREGAGVTVAHGLGNLGDRVRLVLQQLVGPFHPRSLQAVVNRHGSLPCPTTPSFVARSGIAASRRSALSGKYMLVHAEMIGRRPLAASPPL